MTHSKAKKPRKNLYITMGIGLLFAVLAIASVVIIVVTADRDSEPVYTSERENREDYYKDAPTRSDSLFGDYTGIQERAYTAASRSVAFAVERKAKAYFVKTNSYPKTIDDFNKYPASTLQASDGKKYKVSDNMPAKNNHETVQYKYCSADSAQVMYYDYTTGNAVICPLGNASSSTVC